MIPKYCEELEPKLKQFSDFLGTKKFLLGDCISVADFPFYDILKIHNHMNSELVCKFPNLVVFTQRLEEDPKIKAFLASDKNFKDFFPPMASFKYPTK